MGKVNQDRRGTRAKPNGAPAESARPASQRLSRGGKGQPKMGAGAKPSPRGKATGKRDVKAGKKALDSGNELHRRQHGRDVQVPRYAIRELDPLRVCGDRTTVIALYRVDERPITPPTGRVSRKAAVEGRHVHLVFNDRHGWYCEHGRSCHAVSAVMKHAGIR